MSENKKHYCHWSINPNCIYYNGGECMSHNPEEECFDIYAYWEDGEAYEDPFI